LYRLIRKLLLPHWRLDLLPADSGRHVLGGHDHHGDLLQLWRFLQHAILLIISTSFGLIAHMHSVPGRVGDCATLTFLRSSYPVISGIQ
jgi:hypothetical protein